MDPIIIDYEKCIGSGLGVYHRSNMATIVEVYFRVLGTKDNFADAHNT